MIDVMHSKILLWLNIFAYAVYMDTNGLRSAGQSLNEPWINELLSITNKYGISLCICELVLNEWCEHIFEILASNRQKLLSSIKILKDYNIQIPHIESKDIGLLKKHDFIKIVTQKLENSGFTIVENWDAPLSKLIDEAVIKKPPFEHGGKGFCDAVILESYVEHAKANFSDKRVIVISNDAAVQRSEDRFNSSGVTVDFLGQSNIVEKLKALLNDEIATFIKERKKRLKKYILEYESKIIDYVKRHPFEITDWMIDGRYTKEANCIDGSIERLISVRPTKITSVIDGTKPYGEEIPSDRYPVQIFVELEIDLVVKSYGFSRPSLKRATVQPDIINENSPVIFEDTVDYNPKEITKTIKRSVSVFATLDAEKEKKNILDDLKIVKVN
ncbi:MAG: PIN domain-containing protein [bacterium]